MGIESLRRKEDGTVYARKCEECGAQWKIYQKPCHNKGCPFGFKTDFSYPDLVHGSWKDVPVNLYLVAFRVPAVSYKVLAPDGEKALQEARKLIQRQQVHWGSELVIVEIVTLVEEDVRGGECGKERD